LLALLWPVPLAAAPQWTGSLRPGIAGVGTRDGVWDSTAFYGAAYADVLFGRSSSNDFGWGPFLDCSTVAFSDLRLSSGIGLLAPVSSIAVQLSAGPYTVLDSANAAGLHSQLFVGGRSYNHYGWYSSAIGLVIGLDYALSGRNEVVLSAAAVLDAQYLALPFLLLYGAVQPNE